MKPPEPVTRLTSLGLMLPDDAPLALVVDTLGQGAYLRPLALFLDRPDSHLQAVLAQCQEAAGLGARIVLTVRSNGDHQKPTTPPTLDWYETHLTEALTLLAPYISVVVIENEENWPHYWAGTPAEYLDHLSVAAAVCKRLGLACTDGGLVSRAGAGLAIEADYKALDAESRGLRRLSAFLRLLKSAALEAEKEALLADARAVYPEVWIASWEDLGRILSRRERDMDPERQIAYGLADTGIDLVNFHLYVSSASVLARVVAFLRRITGNLPVMTNEIGLHEGPGTTPETVREIARMLRKLGVEPAVWYCFKESPRSPVQPLFDATGALNEFGASYRDVASETIVEVTRWGG